MLTFTRSTHFISIVVAVTVVVVVVVVVATRRTMLLQAHAYTTERTQLNLIDIDRDLLKASKECEM